MGTPTFYVASPIGERTAGPEALTQLVDAIRRRGEQAFLIPLHNFRGRRNDPEYDIYDFSVTERIEDPDNAYLVHTEISPIESMREIRQLPAERRWLAWLSVNNSPDPRARYYRPSESGCPTFPPEIYREPFPATLAPPVRADFNLPSYVEQGPFKKIREARRRVGAHGISRLKPTAIETVSMAYAQRVANQTPNFIAQSFYAQGFCRETFNRDSHLITDPLRRIPKPDVVKRSKTVVYNGAKGWSMVPELIKAMPDVTFQPLEKMSYVELCEAVASATVYVELGHLPGRDRLPREASYLGTPVVFLARGSAYCWQDAPVPSRFRVSFRQGWAAEMVPALRAVLDDPDQALREQESYRGWVEDEPARYETAIDSWLEAALRV